MPNKPVEGKELLPAIVITCDMARAIEVYRDAQRMVTTAEAVRRLLATALGDVHAAG